MPAVQHRLPRSAVDGVFSWWRRRRTWSNQDWAIALAIATGFAICLFIISPKSVSRKFTDSNSYLGSGGAGSELVPFTPSSTAREKSAFCLDGSVPGYHLRRGFGSGSRNWLLHIEGGGWCNTISSCSARKRTPLGSSTYMDQAQFSGILSQDPLQNPDFFNWNKVKIRYCDGSSFSSCPDRELTNGTKLFFRGQLIWDAIMDELLSIGMSNAREGFLTGCSAGGLATLLHCEAFHDLLPKDANVKCLADAGFFINEQDVTGKHTIESFYRNVVDLQGVAKSLNQDCVARSEPSKCFFPQEFIRSIKTPIFLVQPAYDFWQIANILVPTTSDRSGSWTQCKQSIFQCDSRQLEVLHGYRNAMLKTLSEFQQNPNVGMFVNSCFAHCQTWATETWHSPKSPRINNKTIAESVGDWYFKRGPAKHVDCPFPCNPTCHHLNLTPRD